MPVYSMSNPKNQRHIIIHREKRDRERAHASSLSRAITFQESLLLLLLLDLNGLAFEKEARLANDQKLSFLSLSLSLSISLIRAFFSLSFQSEFQRYE